tara:strand:- start:63 stop:311 length:249 start_codon:yes stop_codon:yes gene_type:complete
MKDLQAFLDNIIDIFTTKKSLPNDVMNDFIKYFYFTLDKEIKSTKSEVLKNKYIKIRKNGLYYIVANKEAIMANIRKKKLSK